MNPQQSGRRVSIMGIRGVPAAHGGFETFAERLAPYLAERGWQVTVYCQEKGKRPARESHWQQVRRVHIGVEGDSAASSVHFDWACVSHAITERPPVVLTLGYNTAVFGWRLRAAGIANLINMDGIEWSRAKWGPMARAWLYFNDWAGCLGGSHLIADHPEIARHLRRRVSDSRISMIPYGTDVGVECDRAELDRFGVAPQEYLTLIARPEPENSVLELVRAFSAKPRGVKLLVLGNYEPDVVPYHAEVKQAASDEVVFAGAVYERSTVAALRRYSLAYMHGHRVGGTNPSLLEAMGAGNPVIAHDNRFNRWVAGDGAGYFTDAASCQRVLDRLLVDAGLRERMARANLERATRRFNWPLVLGQYERTLNALHATTLGLPDAARPPLAGRVDGEENLDPR